MQTYKSTRHQRGVTLIVTLIVLVAMTTLGLSSIRSTGIQQTIIKNTQFLLSARNVAKTEINGQLGAINNNPPSATDAALQFLIDQGVDSELVIADTLGTNTSAARLTTIAVTQQTYGQQVSMTMNCRSCPAPMGGFSYGSGIAALTATITSTAELDSAAAQSTQDQGYWYLVPAVN
jgi:Tfp pilus assembly protein PilX